MHSTVRVVCPEEHFSRLRFLFDTALGKRINCNDVTRPKIESIQLDAKRQFSNRALVTGLAGDREHFNWKKSWGKTKNATRFVCPDSGTGL